MLAFKNHLSNHGVLDQMSCPGTPKQNSVGKRKHRHVVNMWLTMTFDTKVSLELEVEVFLTVVYLINQLPYKPLKLETLYFHLFKSHPNYGSLGVLGLNVILI